MFNAKKQSLNESSLKTSDTALKNSFLNAGMKKSSETLSGNGAKKYASTGNEFVNQFGSLGIYKQPRYFKAISNDCATLYAINPRLMVMFILYIRMITRITQFFSGVKTEETQKGAGLRYEGIMRMVWLHVNHTDVFWKNIHLFISVGSWKDVIMMLQYDLTHHGWKDRVLDWNKFRDLLLAGLENPNTTNLVKKYLPQIKTNSACKTVDAQADNAIAKWLCSILFGGKSQADTYVHYREYRKLKVSGTAHQWQQLISKGLMLKINFDTIHGRALSQLVSGKFLANQGLEVKYETWIASKPIAKFTGYVYELASNIKHDMKKYQIDTVNAQYNNLLELGGKTTGKFIVVKDTSGSMDSKAHGTNVSSYHIAKSLSIYLANLLQGWFHNHYIDFSTNATLRALKGSNFVEYWNTEQRLMSANTNFLAVAKLFCSILNNERVPEKEFPSGIICISDGEFDSTKMYDKTNIQAFKTILSDYGFSKFYVDNFTFVFWDIRNDFYNRNDKTKFESYGPEKNVFYFGGFDASVITFITGVENKSKKLPTTAEELFEAAMDQEILNMVEI